MLLHPDMPAARQLARIAAVAAAAAMHAGPYAPTAHEVDAMIDHAPGLPAPAG
jgi:fructokinase